MTPLRATYRLQFRNGMDFDQAAAVVPYLSGLGISHVYASPLFQAVPDSTHGYDVTDHGQFDQSLGGFDGFRRFTDALKAAGMGLILDIVPNHMAVSVHNPWWRDVLRHGRRSQFAHHFDLDWSAPKLTLATLGQPYGDALAAGELGLARDENGWWLTYYEHRFPLDPMTVTGVEPGDSPDADLIHHLHEAQAWRLTYWRLGRDGLTYRRFFEISDLVGVRVESPDVFDDVHRFLLEQVSAGRIQGLRIDHVDGLADPGGYLTRLRAALPGDVPIWVEKILARGEKMPSSWPVTGETGYAMADRLNGILTEGSAAAPLQQSYQDFVGDRRDAEAMKQAAKTEIVTRNLAAERETLTGMALAALAADPSGRDWGPDSIRRSIVALLTAMPVYRTYFWADRDPFENDLTILEDVTLQAERHVELDDPAAVRVVADLLKPDPADHHEARQRFRTRFQQTSGAMMAKAVEDTLFYRFNRLISANEVGGEPEDLDFSLAVFHRTMTRRAATSPKALSATATHDTKRGEDARMRISAISEQPDGWGQAVAAFDTALGSLTGTVDAECRWLAYQALLGAWEPDGLSALRDRFEAYLIKAAREAKTRTSWVAIDEDYEAALSHFARSALSSKAFCSTFDQQAAPFLLIGARKSLVQLALKLMLPGVPDIYQGTERPDYSFVDPDNRRPVDYADLAHHIPSADTFPGAKQRLLQCGLDLRRQAEDAFAGEYRPISTGTDQQGRARPLAFVRAGVASRVMVVADLSGVAGIEQEMADGLAAAEMPLSWVCSEPFPAPPTATSATPSVSVPVWIARSA